jgi:hypothetical protein
LVAVLQLSEDGGKERKGRRRARQKRKDGAARIECAYEICMVFGLERASKGKAKQARLAFYTQTIRLVGQKRVMLLTIPHTKNERVGRFSAGPL